jgi:hypothetical protein
MPWTREQQQSVRDLLARLYPSSNVARRVLWDAGLETAPFDLSGDAKTLWTGVVAQLVEQDNLDAVFAVAQKEYPRNPDVRSLHAATSRAVASPLEAAVDASPPSRAAPSRGGSWRVDTAGVVDFRRLTGAQWAALQRALVEAFPSYQSLAELVRFRLSQNLNAIASSQNLNSTVYELIQWSQARGWTDRLFYAARAEQPDNAALAEFGVAVVAPALGAAPTTVESSGFERVLRLGAPRVKLVDLMRQLGEAQARVCRVERDGRPAGTGFLVGPSAVMTCHHVVDALVARAVEAERFAVRFDWHPGDEGTVHRLDPDWKIDVSPPADFERAGGEGVADVEHLDYAVLRLVGAPGKQSIGADRATPGARERSWFKLPKGDVALTPDDALYIVQHPDGRSMEFAIELTGGATYDATRTRLAHRVNTEPGSSGSPVFTLDGKLVALHHSGRSSVVKTVNQAVPIDAIRARLALKGVLEEIDPTTRP